MVQYIPIVCSKLNCSLETTAHLCSLFCLMTWVSAEKEETGKYIHLPLWLCLAKFSHGLPFQLYPSCKLLDTRGTRSKYTNKYIIKCQVVIRIIKN